MITISAAFDDFKIRVRCFILVVLLLVSLVILTQTSYERNKLSAVQIFGANGFNRIASSLVVILVNMPRCGPMRNHLMA
jgi:TctA family transporter